MRTIKGEENKEIGYDEWNEFQVTDKGEIIKKCYVRLYSKKGNSKVYLTSTRTLPKGNDFRN
jgi:hypothetical protein